MTSLDAAPARQRPGLSTAAAVGTAGAQPSSARGLGPQAFLPIDLPVAAPRILAGFRSLPPAERIGGAVLYRRVHQVRMAWTADDDWLFTMAGANGFGHRPDDAGRRLRTDMTSLLWRALGDLWLDVFTDWHIDVHQLRLVVPASASAPVRPSAPPVGPAVRPGEEVFAMIAIPDRRRAEGGVTLRPRRTAAMAGSTPAALWNRPLRADQALLVDLRAVEYDLWELVGDGRNPAIQDMLISVISRHRES